MVMMHMALVPFTLIWKEGQKGCVSKAQHQEDTHPKSHLSLARIFTGATLSIGFLSCSASDIPGEVSVLSVDGAGAVTPCGVGRCTVFGDGGW